MTNQTARAYVVSRLDDAQLQKLHAVEVREGRRMPPAWIQERFHTAGWGSVPEEVLLNVERVVKATFDRCEAQAKLKGPLTFESDALRVQHETDLEIRGQAIQFTQTDASAVLRDRVRGKTVEATYWREANG